MKEVKHARTTDKPTNGVGAGCVSNRISTNAATAQGQAGFRRQHNYAVLGITGIPQSRLANNVQQGCLQEPV